MAAKQLEWLGFPFAAATVLGLAATLLSGCPRDAVDTKRALTRIELAKDFLSRDELEAAEVEAKKALQFDPRSGDAEYVLGLVEFKRALADLRALEVDDCLVGVDAEALRGTLETKLGKADGHLARAVEFDPEHAEAWSVRGTVADQLGDPTAAISHFERALAYPHRLDVGIARANLGLAYLHKGDAVHAATELRQALQFKPRMCLAQFRLGRVYFERKEWGNAVERFQAVADDKSCPMQEAHLYLLRAAHELGVEEGVDRARATCVAMAPKSCVAAQCKAIP
jgi:Tfp pilus assembly protein PilF